jgi:hypothetical protein
MERLSMASYLSHGHSYHLYTYGSLAGVPSGIVIRDGNEILPESEIGKFRSLASFSDYFRYNLLLKKGGWWCDTDTICLRPFDLNDEHVFVQEYPYELPILINNGYLKAPAGSPVMEWLVAQTQLIDWSTISWGEIGPALVTKAVERFSLPSYPPTAFNPISYKEWTTFIEGSAPQIPEDAFAVHLWHEMWRRAGEHGDAAYPTECLYEQLKRRYGVSVQPGGHSAVAFGARFTRVVRFLKRSVRSVAPLWLIRIKRKISN